MALRLESTSPDDHEEKKADLTEHLAELRTRIIRSCLYLGIGMVVMYVFSKQLYLFLSAPITHAITSVQPHTPGTHPQSSVVVRSFMDFFLIRLQISVVGGLVLALPMIVLELWGFIAPALTPNEKKGVRFVAPMSVLLFILGVSCAYFILPMAVRWFLSFQGDFPGVVLLQDPLVYIIFTVKMLLVFGALFELPVILMFLGKVGIINSALMIKYWRHISVGLFTAAMVVAPSNDPGTMLALAIPLTLLFFGSIWLVKLVEPKNAA